MAKQLSILYATETGTTELVADEIVDAYRKHTDFRFSALRMDKVQPSALKSEETYLFLTSSTGKGEMPRNGRGFYAALETLSPPMVDIRYGLVGFGDRHYAASFGGGPRLLDQAMQAAGARRIGDLAQHDRQSGIYPEEFALEWLKSWLAMLEN